MIKYYEDSNLLIRDMKKDDAQTFFDICQSYGWHKDIETYHEYYCQQQQFTRKVFIAEYNGKAAGICTLVLNGEEGPWAQSNCPEIVDLLVFPNLRNKGIGNKLLDISEKEAFLFSNRVYLAVGVHSGYGAAQRIYVTRGYNFDGSGVWYHNQPLGQYEPCVNDDDLLLFMSKTNK